MKDNAVICTFKVSNFKVRKCVYCLLNAVECFDLDDMLVFWKLVQLLSHVHADVLKLKALSYKDTFSHNSCTN